MRRIVAVVGALTLSLGLVGVLPAQATHNCTDPSCTPISIAVLEGIGYVCNRADTAALAKLGVANNGKCVYHDDSFWSPSNPNYKPVTDWNATNPDGSIKNPALQGLTWPGFGPGADGPFTFTAGPGTDPGASGFCVSTVGDPTQAAGCSFVSGGILKAGSEINAGAYCGSSTGQGFSLFTSGDKSQTVKASFGWAQSAGTILPLQGTVISSTPVGGKGATVVGFTSSRGTGDGANCGISQITTAFNVEGAIVTF